ncbi:hypothetical protein L486_00940 [Kwoniella mangroviensis CBS 10435]|uniref:Uncharacterized protein n=1 Tax=Kwoniella mangroviensis CBS 10435 TaxID=1331196 RepID=A0A1B9J0K4_9TREE|nr:hypothetical protein L486_00940 [Kwoniella mangroviensis CBS 10435]
MERPEQPSTRSGECPSPPARSLSTAGQDQTSQASKDSSRDSYGTFSGVVKEQPTFGSPEDMKYQLRILPQRETSEGASTRLFAPCTSPSEVSQDGTSSSVDPGKDDLTGLTSRPTTRYTAASTSSIGDTKYIFNKEELSSYMNTLKRQLGKFTIDNEARKNSVEGLVRDCDVITKSIGESSTFKKENLAQLSESSQNLLKVIQDEKSGYFEIRDSITSLRRKVEELGLTPRQEVSLINLSKDRPEGEGPCTGCISDFLDGLENNELPNVGLCAAGCCWTICAVSFSVASALFVLTGKSESFWSLR